MYKSEFPEISPLIFRPAAIVVRPLAASVRGAVYAAGVGAAAGALGGRVCIGVTFGSGITGTAATEACGDGLASADLFHI
jgi:hypothetical protein